MRDGWEPVELGALCELVKGNSPAQKTPPGPYPLIVTGPDPLSSVSFQFDGEAVCVPMVSSTGHGHASLKRVHYASGKFAVANIVTACVVRDGEMCDTKFLWHFLHHFKDDLIVSRMKGTANVSLSVRELGKVPIILPPLPEQQRIVDLIGAVDDAIDAASSTTHAANDALARLREDAFRPRENWEESRVGDHLTKVQIPVIVKHRSEYTEIGVRSHGRGVFIKPSTTGAAIGKKRVFRLSPGQLVFNIVFAWEGAVAVLGPESEGKIASHRFPTYVSGKESGVEFLAQFFHTGRGLQLLRLCSPGGAGRNKTLRQTGLMSTIVKLPAVDTWPESTAMLNAAHEWAAASAATGASLRVLRSAMLTALLSGEHVIPESYDEMIGA